MAINSSPPQSSTSLYSSTQIIQIPYNYLPRDYQVPFWVAMTQERKKRAVMIWHRRSGKDKTALNFAVSQMFPENGGRIGTYYHLFPTYAQGKKVMWDGDDKTGYKSMNHFPGFSAHKHPAGIVARKNETELRVELTNGSAYQIIGTDNIDSIRGTNPAGVIYSEYAWQNPQAELILSPILAENGGWAIFNSTPLGHNHCEGLYRMARGNPDWYCSLLTVDNTRDHAGNLVYPPEKIESERQRLIAQGKSESDAETFIQQEYYCSFEGYLEGSYYSEQLRAARAQGRISRVPWRTNEPVYTFWDIGVGDSTAIWFGQRYKHLMLFVDYYEDHGKQLGHYAKILHEKPYTYGGHYWPHDGKNRDFSGREGEDRRDTGQRLGVRPIYIVPRGDIDDGIDSARRLFSQCWFDAKNCAKGLDALASYHKEWDEDRKEFRQRPFHDWASHGADAFRTMAKCRWDLPVQDDTQHRLPPSAMSA